MGNLVSRFLPSMGVFKNKDGSTLAPNQAVLCQDILIDRDNLRVRDGLEHTSYNSDSSEKILSSFKAYYDDGTSATYAVLNTDTPTVRIWNSNGSTTITLPLGVELTDSEVGNFAQFRDSVYYSAVGHDTIKIVKGVNDARLAGTPSPDSIRIIDDCSDETVWTPTGGTNPTVTAETNIYRYIIGDQGVKLLTEGGTATFTNTLDDAVDLTEFKSGLDSSGQDYISFYLYRYEKIRIDSLVLKIYDASNYYFECPVIGIPSVTMEGFSPIGNSVNVWDFDRRDYKIFFIKLRKDWFDKSNAAASWETVSKLVFELEASSTASATNPAEVTIDYINLRGSAPTPTIDGLKIANFENTESWSAGDKVYEYAVDGAFALKLQATTGAGTTSTWDTSNYGGAGVGIDLENLLDGTTISGRDKFIVNLACSTTGIVQTPQVNFTFTDRNDNTAECTFHIGDYAFNSNMTLQTGDGGTPEIVDGPLMATKFRALVFFKYKNSVGTVILMPQFDWSDVKTIAITAKVTVSLLTNTCYIYVDSMRLIRGSYQKYIASFTPGVRDLLSTSDATDTASGLLKGYPRLSEALDWVSENDYLNHFGKYRTIGMGYFEMPDREHAELKRGYASLRITAETSEDEDTNSQGFWNTFVSEVEGFRVIMPFQLNKKIDLTQYKTWTIDSGYEYTVPIDPEDEVRCWVWISDPGSLAKIKFRLYTTDDFTGTPGTDGFFSLFSSADNDEVNYFEYEWDIGKLPWVDPETKDLVTGRQHAQVSEEDTIMAFFEKLTDAGHTYLAPDMPESVYDFLYEWWKEDYGQKVGVTGLPTEVLNKFGATDLNWIIKWKLKDFNFKHGESDTGISPDFSSITGIGIEVVPIQGESVSVSFDNWYVHRVGHLSGMYQYCTTFVDIDGQESMPSAPSDFILAQKEDIYVNNLPPVWPDDVELINVYRKGGSLPTWMKVGAMAKQGQTTYLDNWSDTDLYEVMSISGFPAPQAKVMTVFGNRMAYGNVVDRFEKSYPSRVMLSNPFYPGQCLYDYFRDLTPEDGTEITAMKEFINYNVVFKTRSIWTLDGDRYVPNKRSGKLGCIAKRSVAVLDEGIIFLSHEGIALFNISQASAVIGTTVNDIFTDIIKAGNQSYLTTAVGFVYRNYYWLFYSTDGTNVSDCVCLHLETGKWVNAKFKVDTGVYASVTDFFIDPAADQGFITTNNTTEQYVFDFFSGDDDNGQAISGTYTTGISDFTDDISEKQLKGLFVRASREVTTASYAITLYVDGVQSKWDNLNDGTGTSNISFTRSQSVGADGTPALTTDALTHLHINPLTTGGYTHQLSIVMTNKVIISALSGVFDKLPPLNE